MVQLGSDRARLPWFPWRLHFLPMDLVGGDLSHSLACVPAVSVSGMGTLQCRTDSRMMCQFREDERMVRRACHKACWGQEGHLSISYCGPGSGQARDTEQIAGIPLPSACAHQPPGPRPLPGKVANLQPGEELGQPVGNFGSRSPRTSPTLRTEPEAEARP